MQQEQRHARPARTTAYSLSDIIRDIKALNSSVLLLSQKMNYLVRNEKILGRNLIILNKKIKDLEVRMQSGSFGAVSAGGEGIESGNIKDELEQLKESVERSTALVNDLSNQFDSLKDSFARAEDVKELKYIIDAINPLDFATLKQVEEMLGRKAAIQAPSREEKKKKK